MGGDSWGNPVLAPRRLHPGIHHRTGAEGLFAVDDREHQVLRSIAYAQRLAVAFTAFSVPWIRTASSKVIVASATVTAEPTEADLSSKAGWPMLLSSILNWLRL